MASHQIVNDALDQLANPSPSRTTSPEHQRCARVADATTHATAAHDRVVTSTAASPVWLFCDWRGVAATHLSVDRHREPAIPDSREST